MLLAFEVIQRAQTGDDRAFNEVVLAYRKRILGTIHRLIGRPEDVEDVAQEVFLRLYYSLDQLRTAEVFEPWLYRLTVNAAYDYLRRQKRRNESRMSDLSEQQVMLADATAGGRRNEEDLRRTQQRELVQSLLSTVSEEDRLLLTLKEVEGLSLKELEGVYKVNENALKVRLFRARQRVLKAFAGQAPAAAKAAKGIRTSMNYETHDPERQLDELFAEYRAACPDLEASANFMPLLWQKIEARQTLPQRLWLVTRGILTAAACVCLLLAGLEMAPFASSTLPDIDTDYVADYHAAEPLAGVSFSPANTAPEAER